jgi:hypothetical protein
MWNHAENEKKSPKISNQINHGEYLTLKLNACLINCIGSQMRRFAGVWLVPESGRHALGRLQGVQLGVFGVGILRIFERFFWLHLIQNTCFANNKMGQGAR